MAKSDVLKLLKVGNWVSGEDIQSVGGVGNAMLSAQVMQSPPTRAVLSNEIRSLSMTSPFRKKVISDA
jgi:hypothetical protein